MAEGSTSRTPVVDGRLGAGMAPKRCLTSNLETLRTMEAAERYQAAKLRSGSHKPKTIGEFVFPDLPHMNKIKHDIARPSFNVGFTQVDSVGISTTAPALMRPPKGSTMVADLGTYEIEYYVCNEPNTFTMKLACVAFIKVFMQGQEGGEVADYEDFYSAYASFMAVITAGNIESKIKGTLARRDSSLKAVYCADVPTYDNLMNARFPGLAKDYEAFDDEGICVKPALISICAVMLQTLGRKVNENSVTNWFQNRIESAQNALGAKKLEGFARRPPNYRSLEAGNKAMSCVFFFRRAIFSMIYDMTDHDSLIGHMADHVIDMLAFSEIHYIVTIEKYVMNLMPEVLSCQWLAGEEENIKNMVVFFVECKEKGPYVKFLVEHKYCYAIHRRTLSKLIITATIIAREVEPSYKHYFMEENSLFFRNMEATIKGYLKDRGVKKLRPSKGI